MPSNNIKHLHDFFQILLWQDKIITIISKVYVNNCYGRETYKQNRTNYNMIIPHQKKGGISFEKIKEINITKQLIKGRNKMVNHNNNNTIKNKFPVTRPQQKQNHISINDTVEQNCPKCLGQYFDIVTKLRIFSKLNPKNLSGKDVLIKVEVYLCRDCQHEYGQPIENGKKLN